MAGYELVLEAGSSLVDSSEEDYLVAIAFSAIGERFDGEELVILGWFPLVYTCCAPVLLLCTPGAGDS